MVATRVGGIPEILAGKGSADAEGGDLGILVPPADPDALAAAIAELAQDPGRRSQMAERGRHAVEAAHDPDRWAGQIEQVYREVIGRAS